MATPDPKHPTSPGSARVPVGYVVGYCLLTLLAVGLLCHGAYMAIDNRPGTHHMSFPPVLVQTNPVIITNDRMLAAIDEKMRKADLKQGLWELTIGLPFLRLSCKMALSCMLFNKK
jgi:hypothetical protein